MAPDKLARPVVPEIRRIEDKFMLPYDRNIHFSGRDDLVAKVEEELTRHEPGRQNHRVALYGLGGIGKTQTALEYVYSRRDSGLYRRIYWLSAKDQGSLMSDYRRIANNVGLAVHGLEPAQIAKSVLIWLREEDEWLLILDNLDDITVADGLLPENGARKHLLITTRNPNTDGIPAEGLEVPLLSTDDSRQLFLSLSTVVPSPAEHTLIPIIIKDLGYLPLAIEQAASYVRYVAEDFTTFHKHFQKNHADVLRWIPTANRPYPHSVATTWSMSFKVLQLNFPTSANLLKFLSFLNPDGILVNFLNDGAAFLDDELREVLTTPIEMRKAAFELEQLCLIKRNRVEDTIIRHRLVQTMVRDEMSTDEIRFYSKSTINLFYCMFPDPEPQTIETLQRCRLCQGQMMAWLRVVYSLWNRIARPLPEPYRQGNGVWTIFSKLRRITRNRKENDWVNQFFTISSRLQEFLGYEGSYGDQETILLQLIERQTEILGANHESTLRSMNDLALACGDLGKLAESAKMHEQMLERRRRILGENHPDTLTSMSNLAWTYGNLGKLDEATKMQEQAVKKSRRILGEDHPDTLTSMHNLALAYGELAKLKEAAKINEHVLEKRRRILGRDHRDTLRTMSNLAVVYRELGKLDEAAKMHKQELEKCKRILGEDHPDTLTSMNNLALAYGELGKLSEAAKMHKQEFEKCRRILGEDHPNTLSSMSNLAWTYGAQGKLDEAAKMHEQVLEKIRRILGDDHPNTFRSMNNIAWMYGKLGRLDEAATIYEQVLERQTRVLGETHPETTDSMNFLSEVREKIQENSRKEAST
jgi:tetratricopeptide (TPR) repeat protein